MAYIRCLERPLSYSFAVFNLRSTSFCFFVFDKVKYFNAYAGQKLDSQVFVSFHFFTQFFAVSVSHTLILDFCI